MRAYYRPLAQTDPHRPAGAVTLAGGWAWFDRAERIRRDGTTDLVSAGDLPADLLDRLAAPRDPIAGLTLDRPRIMGILNVTPDSFSDGGQHHAADVAIARAHQMQAEGADIVDVGGESTRPGSEGVTADEEIRRTAPVIEAIRAGTGLPISIDTRKTEVARAAHGAGADLVNDVAGFTHDPDLAPFCASRGLPVCVMHAQGDPATMQVNPTYDHVALDIYDWLEGRIAALEAAGIPRARIMVDPGIGFGKTQAHNLTLLRHLGLFHGLGCPILLGASRKRFIGEIGGTPEMADRAPGSVAVALAALAQGVQMVRVHDVWQTRAAIALWRASVTGQVGA